MPKSKQLSNPYSTGGGGVHFEDRVQTAFAILMLCESSVPCLPGHILTKIQFQTAAEGFQTDDMLLYAQQAGGGRLSKAMCQIKHYVKVSASGEFLEVIKAAWLDFNDQNHYSHGDVFILISGPLSRDDINDVRPLLEWARQTSTATEFFERVEKIRFSSSGKRSKLKIIRRALELANDEAAVGDEATYRFLRAFHWLGYDLDVRAGVAVSLLHTVIGAYGVVDAEFIWGRVLQEVQYASETAGTLTRESMPDELRSHFARPIVTTLPSHLAPVARPSALVSTAATDALAKLVLLGGWNDQNVDDRDVVTQFVGMDYAIWIEDLRKTLALAGSPVDYRNGRWGIRDRRSLVGTVAHHVFDEGLDQLALAAMRVLGEIDSALELESDERFMAPLRDRRLSYSDELRRAIAEALPLVTTCSDDLPHLTRHKTEQISSGVLRKLLENRDWRTWASLDQLLPPLAESNPLVFLEILESEIEHRSTTFVQIFEQEGDGLLGESHHTGLLWALEGLAWDSELLVRVCLILANLAALDPGGIIANRPLNSLITILLPWFPQTLASSDKRTAAISIICREQPIIGWQLATSLLPGKHSTSSSTHRPSWRGTVEVGFEPNILADEYNAQIAQIAGIVVGLADQSFERLQELIEDIEKLPQAQFLTVANAVRSYALSDSGEQNRRVLWERLVVVVARHRRYCDANWALSATDLAQLAEVVEAIAPQSAFEKAKMLFSGKEYELEEEEVSLEVHTETLRVRRLVAVQDLVAQGGIELVTTFAAQIDAPMQVGYALAQVLVEEVDVQRVLLSGLGMSDLSLRNLAYGLVQAKFEERGWNWVDNVDHNAWTNEQVVDFLVVLPFDDKTWSRLESWLGVNVDAYWKRALVRPYSVSSALQLAVEQLLKVGRQREALDCFYSRIRQKEQFTIGEAIAVLNAICESSKQGIQSSAFQIVEIIKILQTHPEVQTGDLVRIEWLFLQLLDRYPGVGPKTIRRALSDDSAFFCEVIRWTYRSEKAKAKVDASPKEVSRARQAIELLRKWKTVPGTKPDGSLDDIKFTQWITSVINECSKSGHLGSALSQIGQVLCYAPPEPDGSLWISRAAADVLNRKDLESVRQGYYIGIKNSRGFHSVDPSGKDEQDLAIAFRKKADLIENAGFQRLALTLRDVADSYEKESGWVKEQFGTDK